MKRYVFPDQSIEPKTWQRDQIRVITRSAGQTDQTERQANRDEISVSNSQSEVQSCLFESKPPPVGGSIVNSLRAVAKEYIFGGFKVSSTGTVKCKEDGRTEEVVWMGQRTSVDGQN